MYIAELVEIIYVYILLLVLVRYLTIYYILETSRGFVGKVSHLRWEKYPTYGGKSIPPKVVGDSFSMH